MIAIARYLSIALLICSGLILSPPAARADFALTFTIDTTSLQTIANDPFAVQFSFFPGGSSSDTATISNFNFDGGSPGGNAWTTYGLPVQGDLSSSIVMSPDTNTYFGQVFQQDFNPGLQLSFTVTFATPLNDGDEFSVQLLSSPTGSTLPSDYSAIQTLDPTYQNNLIDVLTYSTSSPTINTYGSGEPDIPFGSPQFGGANPVPVPPSLYLVMASLPMLVYTSRRMARLQYQY